MFYSNWNGYYNPGFCEDEETVFFVSYTCELRTVPMATGPKVLFGSIVEKTADLAGGYRP